MNPLPPGQFAIADARSRALRPFWAPRPSVDPGEEHRTAFALAWIAVIFRVWMMVNIVLWLF